MQKTYGQERLENSPLTHVLEEYRKSENVNLRCNGENPPESGETLPCGEPCD